VVSDEQLRAARQVPEQPPPAWTLEPASARQMNYIEGLVRTRQIPQNWLLRIKELTERGLTKGDAGKIIQAVKPLPILPGADDTAKNSPTLQDVPPGRYCVQTGPEENDLSFYRIKELPADSGGTYKIILQIAGPQEHMLKGQAAKDAAKRIVRAGIGDSAALYGHKVGRCAICHTRITNRVSRELGIGPVCGGRVYEDWETRVDRAWASLQDRGLDPRENV
jgi:hypothetical protein